MSTKTLEQWQEKYDQATENGAVRKETPKGWMYISTPAE